MKTFELPANAPKTCPACGGEWTYGYIVRQAHNEFGGRYKKTYKWALECRNEGCGLGYFAGSEIEYEETEGLELIDRGKRKQEVGSMAEENTNLGPGKRWGGTYECCRDCGTTERPHIGRGLCSRCYHRHHAAGTLDRFPASKSSAKKRRPGRSATPKTQPESGSDVIDVTFSLRLSDLSPELRQEIKDQVADKLATELADKALAGLGER
jgi:hypothetical protein